MTIWHIYERLGYIYAYIWCIRIRFSMILGKSKMKFWHNRNFLNRYNPKVPKKTLTRPLSFEHKPSQRVIALALRRLYRQVTEGAATSRPTNTWSPNCKTAPQKNSCSQHVDILHSSITGECRIPQTMRSWRNKHWMFLKPKLAKKIIIQWKGRTEKQWNRRQ